MPKMGINQDPLSLLAYGFFLPSLKRLAPAADSAAKTKIARSPVGGAAGAGVAGAGAGSGVGAERTAPSGRTLPESIIFEINLPLRSDRWQP